MTRWCEVQHRPDDGECVGCYLDVAEEFDAKLPFRVITEGPHVGLDGVGHCRWYATRTKTGSPIPGDGLLW